MDAISYSLADKQAKRIKKIINEPDSTSGVVTVPKVIPAGETITIPAGRTAVLPNVQVDGTLTVDGDVFVPSGATYADLENQIATKADTTYVDTQVATKATLAEAQAYDIGVNQTWQDVTASRSNNVTYTNTTGKPIFVYIPFAENTDSQFGIYVDSLYIKAMAYTTTSNEQLMLTIVPNGSTYKAILPSNYYWYELR